MGHPEFPQPSRQSVKERKKDRHVRVTGLNQNKGSVPLWLTEADAYAAVVALTNFIRRALRWLRFCPEARGVNRQLTAPAHLSPCFDRVGFATVSSSWSISTNHSLKSSQRRTQRSKIWQHVASLGLLHRSQCENSRDCIAWDKSRCKAWALKQSNGSQPVRSWMTRTLRLTAGSSRSASTGEAGEGGKEGEGYL